MDELDLIELDIYPQMQAENVNAWREANRCGFSRGALAVIGKAYAATVVAYQVAVKLPANSIERGLAIDAFRAASLELDRVIDEMEQREALALAWHEFVAVLRSTLRKTLGLEAI